MRFWDSSAVVPLVVEERESRSFRDLYRADPEMVAWTFSGLEIMSACCRKRREGRLDAGELRKALARIDRFAARWRPVGDVPGLREHAARVLEAHDLRAADALQLAAALVWADGRTKGRMFVSADARLLEAADAEGFDGVLPA